MVSRDSASATYYPWFDWLRAFLAVIVMLGHDGLIPWSRSGDLAVKVFFALSGWLIGGILLQTERQDLPRFYFNRAIRIWAPYYVALALLLSASLIREPVTGQWLEFVFYKLTFVYNWFGTSQLATNVDAMPLRGTGNHFWSVNAEEQFYLLAPLLLVLLSERLGRSVFVWLVLACLAWLGQQYASIAFGVAAAVVAHSVPGVFRSWRAKALLGITALGSAAAIAVNFHYELIAPFLSICVVLLLAIPGTRQPLGEIAGGMSYPLYLNHWIGVYVANALLQPFGLRGSMTGHALSTLLNIALAVALYWYMDRRLLSHRGGWYSRSRGLWVTRVAYLMVALGFVVGFALLVQRATSL
jgi:peptidoglycan/LPS O-acetylase OafA/YrhL